jgi:hypothetical protein
MNKTLFSLCKRKLFLIYFILTTTVSFSQTTVFQFDFEGNIATAIPNIDTVVGTPTFVFSGLFNISSCQGTYMLPCASWDSGDYYVLGELNYFLFKMPDIVSLAKFSI